MSRLVLENLTFRQAKKLAEWLQKDNGISSKSYLSDNHVGEIKFSNELKSEPDIATVSIFCNTGTGS